MTASTGPKISSREMRCAGEASVNSAGANQKPRSGSEHDDLPQPRALLDAAPHQLVDPRQLRGAS